MGEKLSILGISVEQGGKVAKKIKVGSLSDGSPLEMPIILVNGRESGSILCLNGVLHGTEDGGSEIILKVVRGIDPDKLSGAVVAIPACNPLAYILGIHHVWENPWASYPGYTWGAWANRLTHFLFNEIFSKTNCIVDFHSGDWEMAVRFIYLIDTPETYEKVGKQKEKLAKAFGTGLPIIWDLVKGEQPTLSYHAGMRGIPVITPELGVGAWVKEDVQRGLKGIEDIMKYLGMIDGEPDPSEQISITQKVFKTADHGGYLVPEVSPLTVPYKVSKGEVIARITNLLGNEVDVITSDLDGVVYLATKRRAVRTGDWLYEYGSGPTAVPPKPIAIEKLYV